MHALVLFDTLIRPQLRTCRLNVSRLLGTFALNLSWRVSDSLSLVRLGSMTPCFSTVSLRGYTAATFIGHQSLKDCS